jgi:hypothetical protein
MFVFNRPDLATRVFEAVRRARPRRLLVVADGARPHRAGEQDACTSVRAIFDRVDWPCEVERNFSDENLGCGRRISTGLDWVFRTADEAIVLEDDCFPSSAFFPFCDEILERYRDHEQVMAVTGTNLQFGRKRGDASYYFARDMQVWGWASWRRAWKHYEVRMAEWQSLRDGAWLRETFRDWFAAEYWRYVLDETAAGRVNTWDYQWVFTILRRRGLVVTPNVNLISNLGAGGDATHTTEYGTRFDLPLGSFDGPLVHPRAVERDLAADDFFQRAFTAGAKTKAWLIYRRLKRLTSQRSPRWRRAG